MIDVYEIYELARFASIASSIKLLSTSIRRAQCSDSPRTKFLLEIREQFRQFGRRFDFLKFPARIENPGHLLEIILVVRAQINHAAGRERGAGDFGETFVNEPVFVVSFLRPWIGKINVQRRCRMRRQQIFQKIRRLDAHAAQIRQSGTAALAIQFADAAEQPLDADEIAFRMQLRIIRRETTRRRNPVRLPAAAVWEKSVSNQSVQRWTASCKSNRLTNFHRLHGAS